MDVFGNVLAWNEFDEFLGGNVHRFQGFRIDSYSGGAFDDIERSESG